MPQLQGAILLRHLRKLVKTHQPGHESDRQLLARFLADGEEAAFAALVQRHGPMVLGVCKSVLQHQEDAEDAFQATFLVLAKKAGSIRKQESVSSWLHGVAYRLALKAKSQAGKRRAKEHAAPPPLCDNPVDDLSVREWQAILHDELHRLPEKYRAVLLLCYWEGKTRDEAAEQLGYAKGTLKEHLERARNLLRSRLTRRGLIPSAALFTALFTQNAGQAIAPPLAEATARAAVAFAAGKSAASLSSVVLAQEALRAMKMSRWIKAMIAAVLLGTLGAGMGLFHGWTGAGEAAKVVEQKEPAPAPPLVQQPAKPKEKEQPRPLPAPAKDSDAGQWLKENLDRVEFALAVNGPAKPPPVLVFTTKEIKPAAGADTKYFVITKDEAASIAQTLVDSGLWGRPQEFPEFGPLGRYMTLQPAQWTWSLGRADEDVTSRFIIQHLLKISTGEREQALRDWLAHGVQQPAKADPREASAAPYVRRLSPAGPRLGDQAVFTSEASFAKALAEMIGPPPDIRKVDFARERLVSISWTGAASSTMWFELMPKEEGKVIVFHREHGGAKNLELKTFLFAISNEAVFRVEGHPEPAVADAAARPINFAGLEIEIPDKGFGPPTIIADHQQLAKAIPKSAEQIEKKIDFGKESLYLFRWTGSGADTLSFKVNSGVMGGKEQRIVAFQYQPGGKKTDDSHSYLFAVAKSAVVSVDGIPAPAGRDPLVNEINLAGLQAPMPAKDFGRPVEIRSAEDVAAAFPQKLMQDRIQKLVDFTKETLHYFTWSGSGGDRLGWGVAYRFEGNDLQPVVVYHYQPGVQANDQGHFKLFAVSNKARWRIAQPHGETDKPHVRKLDLRNYQGAEPRNAFDKPTVIASAAELAKAFPEAVQGLIKSQVDFSKEQLLYFAWSSKAGASIETQVDFKSHGEGIEHPIVLFRLQPGKAALAVGYFQLYAVGKDVNWVVAQAAPEAPPPAVREIDMRNFGPQEAKGNVKKPVKITSGDELTAAFLGLFADKAWGGRIAPKVDFKKEYLLLFIWSGSGGDQLTFKTVADKDGAVVEFRYLPGPDPDFKPHVRVYALPRAAAWRFAGEPPAVRPAVREIQTGFIPELWTRGPQQAVRITGLETLAKVFTDRRHYNDVLNQVDFDQEHLLFFNWSGGGGEKLDFRAVESPKGTEVVFRYDATSNDAKARYIRLVAIPRQATWRIEAVRFEGPQKLEVRSIPLALSAPNRLVPAGGGGAKIKNREDAAIYFTDKNIVDDIAKRVDFAREYLVLYAWDGSPDDRLVLKMEVANGQRIAVFQYKPGVDKGRRKHVALFGAPHEFTSRGETLRVPISEPFTTKTRELDILGFEGDKPGVKAGKPLKIENAAAAAEVFKDKAWLDKVLAQVDFKNEHLVYHTWVGAKFDQLSFSIEAGEKGPVVVFHYAMGKNKARGYYYRLFALPNNATWRFEDVGSKK